MKNLLSCVIINIFFSTNLFAQGYQIKCSVTSEDSSTKAYLMTYGNPMILDTVDVVNRQFVFKGKTIKPCTAIVSLNKTRGGTGLWLSNDAIEVIFEIRDYGDGLKLLQSIKVNGPQTSIDYFDNIIKRDELASKYYEANINKFRQLYIEQVSEYISKNPKYLYSLVLLNRSMSDIGTSAVKKMIGIISPTLHNEDSYKSIISKIARNENNFIGKQIADFSLPDSNGVLRSLNSFKKKYTLIQFWSSGCAPCRRENRELVEIYKKRKEELDIIGISLDDDRANWLKAVRKDNITWTDLSDLKGWKGTIAEQFKVFSIPYSVLLDSDKKIVSINPDLDK